MTNYFDKFLEAGKEIIAIPSVQADAVDNMPFGKDVARCLDTVLDMAKSMGFRVRNNNYYYGWAEIGEGELFGILGHLDVVPFGEDWSVSPTSGAIIDGVMYGRGVLDDKLPILSTLFAVKELVDKGYVPNKRIRIIFGCNEESGWQCIKKYVKEDEMPVAAFSPDADFPVIFAEKGVLNLEVTMPLPKPLISIKGGNRPNMVMDRVKAVLVSSDELTTYLDTNKIPYTLDGGEVTLAFEGVSAHGSLPEQGKNALFPLLRILSDTSHGVWDDLDKYLTDITGGALDIAISDEVSKALSLNVGMIYSTDTSLSFTFDIRYPISYNKAYICDRLADKFPNANIKIIGEHDPLYASKDSKLVQGLLDAYNSYTKEKAEPISIGGATYARALKNAVAFGPMFPGRESTIHQKDERVSLDDLKAMYEIYLVAIRNLCFEK